MKYLFALLAVVLVSCATSPQERYSHIETGMTKEQVYALLGQPRKVTYNGALVVLEYELGRQQPAALHDEQPPRSSYYVIIGREDQRVRSFGRN